jgi:hypothetical protein
VELPAASCGIRTELDVTAVESNVRSGMGVQVVSPYASYGIGLGSQLLRVARPKPSLAAIDPPRPLVIADSEAEALSFHTISRDNFKRTKPSPTDSVLQLLSTGPGGDQPAHVVWRKVLKQNGASPLAEWAMLRMMAVHSDVLTIPTSILRQNPDTVEQAFEEASSLVREARTLGQSSFTQFGVALIIHSEIFKRSVQSDRARDHIVRSVQSWARDPRMGDLCLAVKVYDPGMVLNNPESGSYSRQAFGEFVGALGSAIRLSGGLLLVHNVGTWMLGLLHHGADIASFRVTGPRKIDVPLSGGRKGPFEVPPLLIPRALIEVPPEEVQRTFEAAGAYPKPDCVSCEQYWRLPSVSEQRLFCARQRTGVLTELADHYRLAGFDNTIPLEEAVDSLVSEARIKQDLLDLFPQGTRPF